MSSAHSAAYLVLVHDQEDPKALLFSADHNYLSEVIDDEFVVDTLRSSGRECPKPQRLSLEGVLCASKRNHAMTYFKLGGRAA